MPVAESLLTLHNGADPNVLRNGEVLRSELTPTDNIERSERPTNDYPEPSP
jgi:hypothetical protein